MEKSFERIKWMRNMYLLSGIMFVGIGVWLFVSISESHAPDSLLIAMAALVPVSAVILFVAAIVDKMRGDIAIVVSGNTLTVNNFKKRDIPFSNVSEIKYRRYRAGGSGKGMFSISGMAYKSGDIVLYLTDGSIVKVKNVKNVYAVCSELNALVLRK